MGFNITLTFGNCFITINQIHPTQNRHNPNIVKGRQLRSKNSFSSKLDGIEGLGPKRKQKLMRHFKSLTKIQSASLEDLLAAGLPQKVAENVQRYLTSETETRSES